jgi:hypothetical protein
LGTSQEDSDYALASLHDEICGLNESLATTRQWLAFVTRVEAASGVQSEERRQYAMSANLMSNEMATLKSAYRKETGKSFDVSSCNCKADIFLSGVEPHDTAGLERALCDATNNLAEYEEDLKNIRSEMAQVGYSARPLQRYQWTRDKMFLKETIAALKKSYLRLAGRSLSSSSCSNSE